MSELIECCLNGCASKDLHALLGEVGVRVRGDIEVEFHEEGGEVIRCSLEQVVRRILQESQTSCDLRIPKFLPGPGVSIHDLVLQVFPVGSRFDLFLNFREEAVSDLSAAIRALNEWTTHLRSRFGLADVYCGIDPADDEGTRFFTNGTLGPMLA